MADAALERSWLRYWLIEEAEELYLASTEEEELDALLDALGLILRRLLDAAPGAMARAVTAFAQSQRTRGRVLGGAFDLMASLVHMVGVTARMRDPREQPLREILRAKALARGWPLS